MTIALIHLPAHLGYLILFALTAAESAGVPVPGETALITGGVLAHHGQFDIALVGDNIGYLVGRAGGRRLLERPGPLEDHRRAVLRHGEPFFAKHGPKAVFLARWVVGVRLAAAWLAGINRMHWLTFAFWNALGGIAWATTVGLAAYLLGPAAEQVFKTVGIGGVGVAAVAALAYLAWRRTRSRSRARATPATRPTAEPSA